MVVVRFSPLLENGLSFEVLLVGREVWQRFWSMHLPIVRAKSMLLFIILSRVRIVIVDCAVTCVELLDYGGLLLLANGKPRDNGGLAFLGLQILFKHLFIVFADLFGEDGSHQFVFVEAHAVEQVVLIIGRHLDEHAHGAAISIAVVGRLLFRLQLV